MNLALVKSSFFKLFLYSICLFQASFGYSQQLSISEYDRQQIIAFPGAEGFGKFATGGRGGQIIKVTNLNDSGPGSLRAAIEANGPRIIVFEVSGTIELLSNLNIRNGDLTIAGQTAPGDGITLKNYPLIIRNTGNVIIRFIRSRLGDEKFVEANALTIRADSNGLSPENIIIDHCSFSWGTDQTLSVANSKNITVQNSIISEGLNNSVHDKGNHGFGSLISGNRISFFNVLWSSFVLRNPQIQRGNISGESFVDLRNSVVYNWSNRAIEVTSNANLNVVASYFKPGPSTYNVNFGNGNGPRSFLNIIGSNSQSEYGLFFLKDNFITSKDLSSDQWEGVRNENSGININLLKSNSLTGSFGDIANYFSNTFSPQKSYEIVLSIAGASLKRDAVDDRIVNEVRTGSFTYKGSKGSNFGIIDSQRDVGGWPNLRSLPAPLDTDGDGIPDAWELANGLNPQVPNDKEYNLSPYYTDIEVYINSLVQDLVNAQSPGVPQRVQLTLPSNNQSVVPVEISLAWRPLSNAQSYTLQFSKTSDFSSGVITVNNIVNHSVVYPSLDPNSTYFWRVRARNASGNGPYSLVGTFRTTTTNVVPDRTVLLSPSTDAQGASLTPLFTWAKVPNTTTYRIQVSTTSDFSNLVINQSNLAANQFQATVRLQENRTYFWRVRASNATGNGSNSLVGTFRTVSFNTNPEPVVALSPSNGIKVNTVNVNLKWLENASSERYHIQVATDREFSSRIIDRFGAEGDAFLIPNLNSNTVYFWRIRGINRSGTGNFTSTHSFQTALFTERPKAQVLISPVNDSNIFSTSITFEWEADPIAQSYRFQLSTNPNFSSFVTNVGGLTGTSRTVSNLTTNRDYYWRVQAVNEAGAGEFSEVRKVRAATFSGTPPATTLISPLNDAVVGAATVLFSWENQPNTEFYRLEISENSNFSSAAFVRTLIRGTSIAVEGLQTNRTYFWRVRTSNPAGNGERSEIWSFRTVSGEINLYPTSPISPQKASNFKNSDINFSWAAVSEATAYHLQVSERSDFSTITFQNQNISTTTFNLASLNSGKAYFWRVRARNGSIFSAWSAVWNFSIGSQDNLLNVGLVGYWPMEEGSGNRMLDQSGNNLHATIQDPRNVGWVEGQQGRAISLPGNIGRFGVVTHQPVLNIPNTLTLAAWVRPSHINRGTIFSKSAGNGFELWLDINGNVEFRLNRGINGGTYRLVSNFNYGSSLNQWIHVAATFDGTTSTIYINGEEDISRTYAPFTIGTSSGNLTLGSMGDIQRWSGDLDELRLYNRALNKNEILLLMGEVPTSESNTPTSGIGLVGHWKMDEGSGNQLLDASGNQFHATLLTTFNIIWESGVLGQAIRLPGSSNRFGTVSHHPKLSLPNAITITAWVSPTELGRSTIISKAAGNGFELWLDINGFIEFRLNRGHNNATYRLRSNFNYSQTVGRWIHVAATFDGQTSKIFINGIEDISQTYQPFGIGTNSGDLIIGALGTIQRFAGRMDDLRLYERALTNAEIQQLVSAASNNRNSDQEFADYFEGLNLGIKDDALEFVNPEIAQKLVLFPNPVNHQLTVANVWIPDGEVDLVLYDVKGSVVLQAKSKVQHASLTLDIASLNLKPGYYIIVLQDRFTRETLKFIKN